MKKLISLEVLILCAGTMLTLCGCSSTIVYEHTWPEYKCDNCCVGKPYLNPTRNACGRVLPPPNGPWYFRKSPKERACK